MKLMEEMESIFIPFTQGEQNPLSCQILIIFLNQFLVLIVMENISLVWIFINFSSSPGAFPTFTDTDFQFTVINTLP